MKIRLLSLLILLAALLSLSACGDGNEGVVLPPVPDGMQIAAICPEYTFFVPEDWTVDASGGVPMAYVSEVDTSNVTLVRIEGESDPIAFFNDSLPTLQSTFKDFTMVSENNNVTLGGKPAILRTYRGTFDRMEAEVSYTVKQYIAAVDGAIYLMTYTAKNEVPSGELTYFERYEPMVADAAAALLFAGVELPAAEGEEGTPTTKDGLILVSDPAISPYSLYLPEGYEILLNNGTTAATLDGVSITAQYEAPRASYVYVYWEERCEAYKSLYPDFDIIEEECSAITNSVEEVEVELWLDGYQAARYVFTFTRDGVTYKTQKVLTLKGSYIYILSYTARLTPEADGTVPYDAHKADFSAALAAFTFD